MFDPRSGVVSSSFLRDGNVGRRLLSDILAARSYAETKPNGRKETHHENVERVARYHVKRFPKHEDAIMRAFKFVDEKRVLPSMRTMQFAGTAIDRSHARAFNCTFANVTSWRDIADLFWLSMNGCGAGYSVQRRHVSQLPVIVPGHEELFRVQDNKESWSDSMIRLFENPLCRFDYSAVRPEGAPLSTGGTASGPKPLRDAHERIRKILLGAVGRRLRPIEVHDSICHMSDAVVVGGVRRSALIVLFDADDREMLACKAGDWRVSNPQRERANNSAVLHRADPDLQEKINRIMDACYESFSGEPGLFMTNDLDYGTNACQPAWATVLTPAGIRTFADIDVGSTIWSGACWTKIIRKIATGIKPVYEYRTTAGSFVGTENHRVVERGVKTEARHAASIDISYAETPDVLRHLPQDVMDGLVLGDGSVHKASNNKVIVHIGENDIDVLSSEIKHLFVEHRPGISPTAWDIQTTITADELPLTFQRKIPDRFKYGSCTTVAGFLRGLYAANGSVCDKRVTLKASSFNVISDVQQMLGGLGITSYWTCTKAHDVKFSNGVYTCRKSYDLNITSDRTKFQNIIGFIHTTKHTKLINAITETKQSNKAKKESFDIMEVVGCGDHEVFDITVDADEHTYWTGGMLVSNCGEISLASKQLCNLSEVNVAVCRTPEEFYRAVEAATIIGTLQATLTDFPYIQRAWRENCERDALLGVSLTGQAENWRLLSEPTTLQTGARLMMSCNAEWAAKLGINPAARLGTTKPSGSASVYLQTTSGIHGAYDDWFLRRMQVEKENPIAQYMIESFGLGEPGEGRIVEQHYRRSGTVQIAAPHAAPDAIIASRESAISLLERAQHIKRHWIAGSHRDGPNTHNVSMTVYYGEDEREPIKAWLAANHGGVTGVSFLPRDTGAYRGTQMPFESIDRESFERWSTALNGFQFDVQAIDFSHAADERIGEAACAGGACQIL